MAKKTITNLNDIVDRYTRDYLFLNKDDYKSDVPGPAGPQGISITGPKGDDGEPGADLTVEQIGYNGDGTFTWQFSDGTSYTTPDMTGMQGEQGEVGVKGDRGISVHHTKGTNTTDPEGDFATAGEVDTYTMYGDADEMINLGHFNVMNGLSGGSSVGLMYRSTYDLDSTGVVDNAEAVGGKSLATIEAERDAAIQAAELALGTNYTVADNAGKDTLTGLTVSDKVFVTDDGDGKWAQYWVTAVTDGLGSTSTFEVVMDEDTYLNSNSAASIKTTYESNANTNEFNDDEKFRLTYVDQDVTVDGTPSFDSVQLNGGTGSDGTFAWNVDEEAVDLVMGDATLQVGQEFLVNVRNNSGSLIANGTPVMFAGTLGNSSRLLAAPMDGSTKDNQMKLLGFATSDIVDGQDGKVTLFGKVRHLDTTGTPYGEVWSDGEVLYIDTTVVGGLTNVEPPSDKLSMAVAVVVKAHSNGSLYVRSMPIDRNANNAANNILVSPVGSLTENNVQLALEKFQVDLDELLVVTEW